MAVSCWHSNVNLTPGSISQTQFCTCTGLDGDTACLLTDFPWTSPAHHICSHVLSTSFMIWKLAIIATCMWLANQAYSTLKQWMNTLNSLPPFTYEYSTWEVMWAWQSICCGSWHPLHNQDTQVLRLTGILGIQNPWLIFYSWHHFKRKIPYLIVQ